MPYIHIIYIVHGKHAKRTQNTLKGLIFHVKTRKNAQNTYKYIKKTRKSLHISKKIPYFVTDLRENPAARRFY